LVSTDEVARELGVSTVSMTREVLKPGYTLCSWEGPGNKGRVSLSYDVIEEDVAQLKRQVADKDWMRTSRLDIGDGAFDVSFGIEVLRGDAVLLALGSANGGIGTNQLQVDLARLAVSRMN